MHRSTLFFIFVTFVCSNTAGFAQLNFPDFGNNPSGIIPLSQGSVVGDVFRLTQDSFTNSDRGGLQFTNAQNVIDPFEVLFDFQITSAANSGGQGFALVIHTNNNDIGDGGSLLGYNRIDDVFAIEFDTNENASLSDPNDNHISAHLALGSDPPGPNHAITELSSAIPDFDLNDGNVHTIRILNVGQNVSLFADGIELIDTQVDLSSIGLINGTDAFIGFTSGINQNGAANHDILNFSFTAVPEPSSTTMLAVISVFGLVRRKKR